MTASEQVFLVTQITSLMKTAGKKKSELLDIHLHQNQILLFMYCSEGPDVTLNQIRGESWSDSNGNGASPAILLVPIACWVRMP